MHVVFTKDYDIYKAGGDYILERTLGAKMCEMGVAMTYSDHVQMEVEARRKKAKADEKAEALKAKAAEKKKTAVSKKATRRSKAVK